MINHLVHVMRNIKTATTEEEIPLEEMMKKSNNSCSGYLGLRGRLAVDTHRNNYDLSSAVDDASMVYVWEEIPPE